MKRNYSYILLFFLFLYPLLSFAQDVNIDEMDLLETCDGRFFDKGGPDGTYGPPGNPPVNDQITICPDDDEMRIRVDFSDYTFLLASGADFLYVYDGDSDQAPLIGAYTGNTNPGVIVAGDANSSGCLTFVFETDGAPAPLPGWGADITCVEHCQSIDMVLGNLTPRQNDVLSQTENTVFWNDMVTFTDASVFGNSDDGANWHWDFGDGGQADGKVVSHAFTDMGTYTVTVTITDQDNCVFVYSFIVHVVYDEEAPGPGCPNAEIEGEYMDIDGNWVIPCNQETTTLTADYLKTGETTQYTVESIEYNPPFPFTGGSGSTNITADDVWSEVINLNMDFCFYGNVFDKALVGSNGEVTFSVAGPNGNGGQYMPGNNSGYSFSQPIPHVGNPPHINTIFGVLQDTYPFQSFDDWSINYEVLGEFPCRMLVVNFYNLGLFSDSYGCGTNQGGQTYQIVIYETTNAIDVYVKHRQACTGFNSGSGLIGIQNGTGTQALAPPGRNTGAWNATNEAWRFTPSGDPNYEFVWLDEDGEEFSTDDSIVVGPGCYTAKVVYENCNGETVEALSTVCVEQQMGGDIDDDLIENIYLCDYDNVGSAEFDLTINGLNLLLPSENPDDFEAFYYASSDDFTNDNPIANPEAYVNIENPQQIIGVLKKQDIECDIIFNFEIGIFSAGEANEASDLCETGNENPIDLTLQDDEILGDQDSDEYSVTYFLSEEDAENGENPIEDPENYIMNPFGCTEIFARVQNVNVDIDEDGFEGCFGITSFQVCQFAIGEMEDIERCDDDGEGFTQFDLTVNQNLALDGLSAGEFSVSYYTSEADAEEGENPINNPGSFTNTVNPQTIYVRLENNEEENECFDIGAFTIEAFSSGIANQPEDLVMCSLDDSDIIYDLTQVIDEVLDGQDPSEFDIRFFETENQAANDNNEIQNPGSYLAQDGNQTIWVRIENAEHPECFNLTSFQLKTTTVTIGEDLPKIEVCYDETMNEVQFNLTQNANAILDGQSPIQYVITYYTNENDAENGTNAIEEPNAYVTTPNLQVIWVRIEANGVEDCFRTGSFEIEGTEADPINHDPTPLQVCDPDNDGFSPDFDLTSKDEEITLGDDSMTVTYHLTESDMINGVNPIQSPYANINPYTQIVWVRIEQENGCELFTQLILEVHDTPQLLTQIDPIELCEIEDGSGFAIFDLIAVSYDIFQDPNEDPNNYDISYHLSEEDAINDENEIPNPGTFTNLTPYQQSIWIRVEAPDGPGCFDIIEVELIVHETPEAVQPDPLELCDDFESGSTDDEVSIFDLTVKNQEIKGGNNALEITWYETEQDEENDNPIADPTAYANIANAQTVVARVTNEWGCYTTVTLTLVVNPVPTPTPAEDLEPYTVCDENNDGFGVFDLSTQDVYIINDEQNVEVSYHATEAAAEAGHPSLPNNYVNITPNEQVIYARLTNTETGCYAWTELTLKVVPAPTMPNHLEDIFACGVNGQNAVLDLTQNEADIYGDQDPEDYEISYYETEEDALNGTNPIGHPESYDFEGPGPETIWVRIDAIGAEANACMKIGSFQIQAGEEMEIFTPSPLAVCDDTYEDTNDQLGLFDLTLSIPEITGGNNSYLVEFFETQEDLDNDEPIENPQEYVNISNAQTLLVRVTSSQGCEAFTTLTIEVLPEPNMPEELEDMEVCDIDNDGYGEFDLAGEIPFILNGQPNVSISFHLTEAGAQNNNQTIDHEAGPFQNSSPWEQTIWVRVENTGSGDIDATGCFAIRPLKLIVLESPHIQNLEDLYVCDDGDFNGFAVFDLTVNEDNIFGGNPAPADVVVTYHESQENAENGTNAIAVPTNYTNVTNPQRIYVRVENTETGCYDTFDYPNDNSFMLYVEEVPQLEDAHLTVCDDDYEQAPYPQAVFDLYDALEDLTGSAYLPNHQEIHFYASEADMNNGNPIANPNAYVNEQNPQDVYVEVINTNTENSCLATAILTLEVLPLPTPEDLDQDELRLVACDDNNDGIAAEPFDLTLSGLMIAGGENVDLTYWKTEDAAEVGDTNSPEYIDDPENYVNEPAYNIPNPNGTPSNVQVIYVRVSSGAVGNDCFVIVSFEIKVEKAPVLNPLGDPFGYTLCEDGNSGSAVLPIDDIAYFLYDFAGGVPSNLIDLLDPNPSLGQSTDPADYDITYYTSEADAEQGINPIGPGYVATDGETIYVRVENLETGCYNTGNIGAIVITVEPRPAINPITITSDAFCSDEQGGNMATVDLTQYDDSFNPSDNTETEVVYYANIDDYNNHHPIEDPENASVYQGQEIIVEVIDSNTLCGSAQTGKLRIKVEARPVVDLSEYDGMIICVDLDPILTPVEDMGPSSVLLDTGLPNDGTYLFAWTLDGVTLSENGPALEATQAGEYTVEVSNNGGQNCSTTATVTIEQNNPPEFSVKPTRPAFDDNGGALVFNVQGNGDYEFRIDDGPWTDLGEDGTLVFNNLTPGEHFIYGRDKGGCGITMIPFSLIDYPDFFTPNNDGYNDTWNIYGLEDQTDAKIYIFDRYGKLLKQIQPDGEGWDGTYNGKGLPSNDYWFRVEYRETTISSDGSFTTYPATFKGHFTLKR